jgi:hypothetical protein
VFGEGGHSLGIILWIGNEGKGKRGGRRRREKRIKDKE